MFLDVMADGHALVPISFWAYPKTGQDAYILEVQSTFWDRLLLHFVRMTILALHFGEIVRFLHGLANIAINDGRAGKAQL